MRRRPGGRVRGLPRWAWLSVMLCACAEPDAYRCAVDSDCVVEDASGRCELNAFCSYPDIACDPGRRWGPFAGDGLADGCSTEEVLPASYAGCAGPSTGPADCERFAGNGRIDVDIFDGDTSERSTGYVFFDLASLPAGAFVLTAELELTAADSADAASDAGGRVVPVEPFTAAGLEGGLPAALPAATPSEAPGSVALGQRVMWTLDPALVVPGETLYLSIEPGSSDNVQYWSLSGAVPPRLLLQLSR